MREILSDLVAEEQSLDQFLQGLHERDWKLPTMAPGWSIHDTISHLAFTEWAAHDAINGSGPGPITLDELDEWTEQGVIEGRPKRYQEVIEWWRSGRAAVVDALSKKMPNERIDWILAPMSAKAFATLRLMETWAHGLDVKAAVLGRITPIPEDDLEEDEEDPVADTTRLRHIAWLGQKSLPFAFEQAGEEYPEKGIRVVVMGPLYSAWRFGPEDTDQVIKGRASDWCRLVVQRTTADETGLKAVGEHAEKALGLARAY